MNDAIDLRPNRPTIVWDCSTDQVSPIRAAVPCGSHSQSGKAVLTDPSDVALTDAHTPKGQRPHPFQERPRTVVHVIRDVVIGALRGLGVPSHILANVPESLDDVRGLLVYGSRARGDSVPGSDLDLLALVGTPRPSTYVGDVNISHYTAEQLKTGIGTLFGAHLKRDSRIIWDPDDLLTTAIAALGDVDTNRVLRRAREMSQLFTTLDRDLPRYLPGLLREARYLLRSCLYAQAIAVGQPCFSVRELAVRHGDRSLALLLASRQEGEPAEADLDECLSRLHQIVGSFPPSRNGSLEATIVNEWDHPGDLLSVAFLALGITGRGSDYAEVEKVLL